MKLNRKETAEFFGVAKTTIDAWRGQGCPVESTGGKGTPVIFNSTKVFKWHMQRKPNDDQDYSTLLEFEKYRKEKRRNDVEEKKFVLVADVKKEAFEIARIVRDSILNIPHRISPELATLTDIHAVSVKLETELTQALEELSEYKHEK